MTMGAEEGVPVDPRTEELMLLQEAGTTLALGAAAFSTLSLTLGEIGLEQSAVLCARYGLTLIALSERVSDAVKRVEAPGYDREEHAQRVARELAQAVQG